MSAEDGDDVLPGGRVELLPGDVGIDPVAKGIEGVDDTANIAGSDINPGRFFDQQEVETKAGETSVVKFKYVPFNPQACQGAATAEIALLQADGEPAAGKRVKIDWFDGHYGAIPVLAGVVPDDGVVKLEGVAAKQRRGAAFPAYTVSVDEERIGFFDLEETEETQTFKFRLASQSGEIRWLLGTGWTWRDVSKSCRSTKKTRRCDGRSEEARRDRRIP